jgi:hypothetical protein
MKVGGFTIVRNAVRYDYPVVEAIRSVLPLVDIMVVAVGQSEDETLALIKSIDDPRIQILPTVWDDSLREGGRVLAVETDKAKDALPPDLDWCFYIQADEIVHPDSYEAIRKSMLQWKDDPRTEGLLFNYRHFYGSYDFVGDSRQWYRREVRIVRRDAAIKSWKDAQGFRKNTAKLKVRHCGGIIHHYGWVKPPEAQQLKQKSFNKFWHTDEWVAENIPDTTTFDYSGIDSLVKFTGVHPPVIQERINAMNWKFSFDPSARKISWKERISRWVERFTGWRPGEYKNYQWLRS